MNTTLFPRCLLLAGVLLPLAAQAQTTSAPVTTDTTVRTTYGPTKGTREFTIGASGSSDKRFDSNFGGVGFSLGYFYTDALEGLIRQTINFSHAAGMSTNSNGSTHLALDEHFGQSRVRPFLGVNAGRVYGDSVRDGWIAGLEGGFKFYVQPATFVQLTGEYGWLFQHSDEIDDTFNDGGWNWSASVGFNF